MNNANLSRATASGTARRRVASRLWRFWLTALAVAAGLGASAVARPLNVLFIVADDLNTALGCYGHPVVKTPHLDRLAARGVLFERAYCQYPLCQPSRASFMSGLRPETTRVWTLDTPTRQFIGDAVMLPELFRKNGWFSTHAGKVYHTGEACEDPRSWDEELREFGKTPLPEEVLEKGRSQGPKGHSFEWMILKTADADTPDGIVARKSVEWMERCAREGKPFFLGVGFRRPHAPYAAPKKYFDLYPPERMPLPRTSPEEFQRLLPAAINHEPPDQPLTDAEVRRYLAAYYACVSFMDAQVGVVLDALERLGLSERTIVVFFSDNGYHLGDHGGLWHKSTLFEESARVPLIVATPGKRAVGKRSSRLVELVDLYPTLAELCGLNPPPNLEGTSFAPLLDDPKRPWKRGAFTMQGRGPERTEAAREILFTGTSVRTERWRYTEWDSGRQGVELYEERRDPREVRNLADSPRHARIRAELQALLRGGWRAALPPVKSTAKTLSK